MMKRRSDPNEYLREVPLFSRLSKDQLQFVARVSDRHRAVPGEHLIEQGRLGHEFLLIVEGAAHVERDGQNVAQAGPGDFFGELALIDGGLRSATVIADTEMELIVVDGRAFWPLLESVPGLAHSVMEVLAARVRQAESATPGH